jgi:transposase
MPKKKVNYRPQRGLPIPQTVIKKVKHLLSKRHGKHPISYQHIADQVGCSKSSVYRIKNQDMGTEARRERARRSGWNKLLSVEQEKIVCGWIIEQTIKFKSTTTKHFRSFINEAFGIHVSPSWITRFIQRHQFSLRSTQPIKKILSKSEAFDEAIAFLERVKAKKKDPSQICCIDKTGVYTDVKTLKQIGPRGG